jgi:hypothetical protein
MYVFLLKTIKQYLKKDINFSTKVTWDKSFVSVLITIKPIAKATKSITFEFKQNNKEIKQTLFLYSKESNLNKGKIWYFYCPTQNKLCTRLYLVTGGFMSRPKSFLYDEQRLGKGLRGRLMFHGGLRDTRDKLQDMYYDVPKGRKYYYNGKYTKWYIALKKKIDRLNRKEENDPFWDLSSYYKFEDSLDKIEYINAKDYKKKLEQLTKEYIKDLDESYKTILNF